MSSSGKGNKFVAKLGLSPNGDAGPFRRIGLGNFAGSHKRLCEAAAELAAADSPETRVIQYKLRLTFKDEDGDSCLILNDSDVKMAFADSKKPVKIFAEVLELSAVAKAPPVATSPEAAAPEPTRVSESTRTVPEPAVPTASNSSERHPPALHQAVESIVGVLANAVIGLQAAVPPESGTETANKEETTAPTAAVKDRSIPEPAAEQKQASESEEAEERPFIHGRHTCDACLSSPLVGARFHAVNMPDYDLCQNCYENYKGDEIQFEEVKLERDIPMQDRWHRRYAKWGTAGRPHARKHGGRRGFGPRGGRCGPRGPRVVPGPPHGPPQGPPPPFAPPHGPPHMHPHQHPHMHYSAPCPTFSEKHGVSAPNGVDFVHYSAPCATFTKKHGVSALEEEEVRPTASDVDAALKEAIRRSMEDMKQTAKETATQTEVKKTNTEGVQTEAPEPEIVADPTEDKKPAAIAETGTSKTSEGSSAKSKTASPKSPPKDAQPDESFVDPEAGETAAVLGDVMDQIALAIRGMNDELERETSQTGDDNDSDAEEDPGAEDKKEVVVETVEDDTKDDKSGAVILGGDSNEDEVSQNSWDVVEDQAAHDESLARAAYAIGSALYESDLTASASRANANANNASGASIDSVPTTLPSLASEAPIPAILAQRWHSQIEQMHNLGFFNDALIVETLERLQAANVGSDVTEEITVTRLVNEMMKDW